MLNTKVLKRIAVEYWQEKPVNRPIKVVSLLRGKLERVVGYITCYKFVAGRSLKEVEKILGLIPGTLAGGAQVYEFLRLPSESEFELRGHTQCPAGEKWTPESEYPAGLGASQWELKQDAEIPSRLAAIIPRDGILKVL